MHCGFIFYITILILFIPGSHLQDFNYHGDHGPNHWGEQYNACFGKHQSPINIQLLNVQSLSVPKLEFQNFDTTPQNTSIKNNGHTVMFTIETNEKPQVSGGPLNGTYQFKQLHFHWGENDTQGSEDLLEGRSFPMELHLVFAKIGYENPLEHADGMTVLAFFYEVADYENVFYQELTDLLLQIKHANTSVAFQKPLSLGQLMHTNLQSYFTYNGSLTTPPCSEVVTWIDFKEPIPLSHEQIHAFRALEDEEGSPLTHNFRPTQPLNDRVVYYVTADEQDDNSLDQEKPIPTTKKPTKPSSEKSTDTSKKLKNNGALILIQKDMIFLSSILPLMIFRLSCFM